MEATQELTVVQRADGETDGVEFVVAGLIHAWNSGNARSFASYFEEEADLVNIHGMHIRGRQAIAGIYDMLFRSVFASSSTKAKVSAVRHLRKSVALVHINIEIKIHVPPRAGTHDSMASAVMVKEGCHWKVASLHSTLMTGARTY